VIRVLELLTSTALGGGPRQVWDLVRHLPRDEFEVTVAGPRDGPFFGRFGELGCRVATVRAARIGLGPLLATLALVRAHRIQVIHSHGKGAGLYGRLAARRTGAAAVHTFHGIHFESYSPVGRRLYLALERRLARWTHTIVSVSVSQEAEGRALGLFGPGQSATVVNGLDVEAQDRLLATMPVGRASLGLAEDAVVVGCVARFDPVKNLGALVAAVERLAARQPRLVLLLVGDGAEKTRLQGLVARAGLGGRVVFAGWLADSARALRTMDLYAAASLKEGLPLALLEAMAAGLAVVATDVPGHRDVVRDGETGLLVPVGDDAALADALGALLADPDRRRRLGRAGRARVLREFAVAPMVEKTAEIYRAAAAAARR